MNKKLVQREYYLDWLKSWCEKQMIKVVAGVRRCGKSTLFELYIDWLLENGVTAEQIISINLEELENERLLDYHELHEYVKVRLCKDKYTYVFIDEVQKCKDFERAVDSLFIKDNVDVYITGSNAYLLSGELATLLSGRYVQISMLPLSFAEYVKFKDIERNDLSKAFDEYIRYGSFPAVATFEEENLVNSYLDGVYDSVIMKDVATRLGIVDVSMLEAISKFLFFNIGSPVSVKKIVDTINSTGRKTSFTVVDRYLKALCDSYLFYKVDRYDIRGRHYLRTQGKYYAVDSGLRRRMISSSTPNLGHILENIVYLELLRRGERVSIGKIEEKEVDFIAENFNGLEYYQVAASVLDENTLKRELASLEKISDNYPKILLTLDVVMKNANYGGIQQYNVIDWLLGEV